MSKGGGGSYFLSSHCRGQNEGNGGCKDTSSFHSKMQNQTVGRAGKGPATRGQLLGPGLWAGGWQRFPCSQWAGSQPGQGWHMTDRLTQPQEGQGCSSLAFHQCSHSGHSPNTAQWIQSLADSVLHSTSNKIQTLHQDLQGPFFFFFFDCAGSSLQCSSFSCCRAQALGCTGSVIAAHGLATLWHVGS